MAGELVFIGLGLHDEKGLSIRGQEEAKSCEFLFAEFYTGVMPGLSMDSLVRLVGRQVQLLSRKEVEERPEQTILAKSKNSKVGFFVPGDPMVATTHVDLRIRAQKAGIRTRIIHAASVASAAAGVSGLQSYKFGRTVTIPVSSQGQLPESIITNIKTNSAAGLHTLVLLEIDVENNRHITIPEALKLVSNPDRTGGAVGAQTLIVGIARIESPDMVVRAGTVSDLMKEDFGKPPYVLIIPARLHFVEAEALELFCGAPRAPVNPPMTEPNEDPGQRARTYISNFEKALHTSNVMVEKNRIDGAAITKVTDAIHRYLEDARYYLENNRPTTSLASIAYAEGLLDALIFLGLAKPDQPSRSSS